MLQFCAEADLPRSEGDYDHLGARSLLRGNDLATCHRAVEDADCGLIADRKLMLDMAVLLSIDVALTMLFCVHHVDLKTSEHVSRRKWVFFIFLKYFPGLLVFPVLFSVGDDHLPASRRIVPGGSLGACGSAAGFDSGIHLWFEMALTGATYPLGTAFPGRGAARIDGHHRYGEWQDSGGRLQQFRCPLASWRYRHRHRRNGNRMGNLQLSN